MARTAVSNRNLVPQATDYSVVFNGSSSYLQLPISFQLATTGFCLSFWIKKYTPYANGRYVNFTQTNLGFQLYDGQNKMWCQMFDGAGAVVNGAGNQFVQDTWTHYIVTFIPNDFRLYKTFNTLELQDTGCVMSLPASQQITLGRISSATSGWGRFRMKNFTLQNTSTPWTLQERTDLYYRNKIPTGATQWSLNNTLLDQNGLNTLTGANTAFSTEVPFIKRPTR